jgi:hypothetical protein
MTLKELTDQSWYSTETTIFDPERVYLILVDIDKVSIDSAQSLGKALESLGVKTVIAIAQPEDFTIYELEKETKDVTT